MFGKIKFTQATTAAGALCLAVFAASASAENYSWGNVRFDGGGFVSAIMPSPAVEGLIYARTDVGGIYRWDAKTSVWIPLMDFLSENDKGLYGTEAFALDPTDPAKIYVLGGTGYFSKGRTAVFRSSDYGDTWDTSYVEFGAHGNGMGRQTGEKLAVDPNKPNIVLCGSRSKGLYKSEDYGKTWKNIYEVATSTATESALNNENGIAFVIFDESQGKTADGNTAVIYLGLSLVSDNLQVSKDGGKTWSVIKGGPEKFMPHRAKIVDGDMFITYADGPGPHSVNSGAVMKYNIASGTWTDITPIEDKVEGEGADTATVWVKDQSSYGGIAIDPKDKNHIVVTTLGKYTGRHHYADDTENYGDRVYVTTDGGKNWTHGQHYNDGFNVETNGTDWIHGNAIHWAGSLEFDPFDNKKVWVTSGNGIFQTDDITAKVPVWKFQSKGIEETVPLDIVSIPDGPLVTAIGDYDGGVYTDINAPVKRHNPIVGSTESMAYAPLTGTLIRTGVVTEYLQYESKNHNMMYRSDDMGVTWKDMEVDGLLKGPKGLLVLSADAKVLLHRPDQSAAVYRSTDNGKTWTETKTGEQTNYSRIVADPVNPDVFYVMNSMGTLYKSTDGGETFEAEAERLQNESAGQYYNGGGLIRTVPGKEGHIWVPLDQSQMWLAKGFSENGLAYTEDGGKTWNHCEGASTAIAVGIGKAKEGADYETIFIWGAAKEGDDIGIYRSTDKCKTFERVNDGAHQYGGPGNGNFVQGDMNNFGVVYMSTVGRGLVVGAPEGTKFVEVTIPTDPSTLPVDTSSSAEKPSTPAANDTSSTTDKPGSVKIFLTSFAKPSLSLQNRNLLVSAPSGGAVQLFSITGKAIMNKTVNGNATINLQQVPSGIYYVKLTGQNNRELISKRIAIK